MNKRQSLVSRRYQARSIMAFIEAIQSTGFVYREPYLQQRLNEMEQYLYDEKLVPEPKYD